MYQIRALIKYKSLVMKAKVVKEFDIILPVGNENIEVVGVEKGSHISITHEFLGQTDIRMVMCHTGGERVIECSTRRYLQNNSL